MKKLLFILFIWLIPLFSFGAINEYLTDVYFANGILTDEGNATANTTILRNAIIDQYGSSLVQQLQLLNPYQNTNDTIKYL